jgi:hypothetical protein
MFNRDTIRSWLYCAVVLPAALLFALPAAAQTVACTGPTAGNCVPTVAFSATGAISTTNPLPVNNNSSAAATITGNAAGSTGAVVGTLAGTAGKTTYICGFNVSAVGGTATVGPITVAGLIGSSQVYQIPVNSTAGAVLVTQTFAPCIAASAANTAITVTTTANGTATAVDVNSWGFQQ